MYRYLSIVKHLSGLVLSARPSTPSMIFCSMALLIGLTLGCAQEEAVPTCPQGYSYCDGFCVSLIDNSEHCGACGVQCGADVACISGMCDPGEVCDAPQVSCSNQCVDPMSDRLHCGGCNNACEGGSTCQTGQCSCGEELTYCLNSCVNTLSDSANCGGCANQCLDGQICAEGQCSNQNSEVCNGEDDDLDGVIDEAEGGGTLTQDCSNLCGPGEMVCNQGLFVNCSSPESRPEECNANDDDCDGLIDEGVTETFYQDMDQDGYGLADMGKAIQACEAPALGYATQIGDCDDSRMDVNPGTPELCDQVDNNCNQTIDEGCECVDNEVVDCGFNVGICQPGTQVCSRGQLGECGGGGYVSPSDERCDQLDNDCDGNVDEGSAADPREGSGNDQCSSSHTLPAVSEGAFQRIRNVNLYSPSGRGDVDWYRILAREEGETDFLELALEAAICAQNDNRQCFEFFIEFTPPQSAVPEDFIICLSLAPEGGNPCGENFTVCTDVYPESLNTETGMYKIGIKWTGTCALPDSKDMIIQIRGRDQNVNYCDAYQMKLSFDKIDPNTCPE